MSLSDAIYSLFCFIGVSGCDYILLLPILCINKFIEAAAKLALWILDLGGEYFFVSFFFNISGSLLNSAVSKSFF